MLVQVSCTSASSFLMDCRIVVIRQQVGLAIPCGTQIRTLVLVVRSCMHQEDQSALIPAACLELILRLASRALTGIVLVVDRVDPRISVILSVFNTRAIKMSSTGLASERSDHKAIVLCYDLC